MKIECPYCQNVTLEVSVASESEAITCDECGLPFSIERSLEFYETEESLLLNPPDGAWYREDAGEIVIGASIRSPRVVFNFIPAVLLVSFPLILLSGIFKGLFTGEWMPPDFYLILTVISVLTAYFAIDFSFQFLMNLAGRVEFTIKGDEVEFFKGAFKLAKTEKFRLSTLNRIRTFSPLGRTNRFGPAGITFDCGHAVEFIATDMRLDRWKFLLKALRLVHARSKSDRKRTSKKSWKRSQMDR